MPTSFAIDKRTRERAQARAMADGISLSSAVRLMLAAYAEGSIAIGAMAAKDAVRVERVEDLPMDAGSAKLAKRIFGAVRKHG